ncbi:MAG: iron-siderophore ABC transporter substrate-binding protein [Rhodococcus sp. (in: high G+C Gram-positive bacteria)]
MTGRLLTTAAATAALVVLVAGCGGPNQTASEISTPSGEGFPVTIEHTFGSTTVDSPPQRIVTMGWNAQDILGALGVSPVGQPRYTYGADDNGVMPWAQQYFDPSTTTLFDDPSAGEPGVETLATLTPDLVLAPYEGFSKPYYDSLSEVAPVVAYPGGAWQTTWQEQTTIIGEAVGRQADAQQLIDGMGERLASEARAHPEFAGKTVSVVSLDVDAGQISVYLPSDPRVQVLHEMGFADAPGVVALDEGDGGDSFYRTISLENAASIDADVIVAFTPEGFEFSSIPALATLPAVTTGSAIALSDTRVVAGLSNVNPVSTPWVLDRLLPQLAGAAAAA